MYLSCCCRASKRYFGYQWISAQNFPYSWCLLSGTRNNIIHSRWNSSLVCKLQQNRHRICIIGAFCMRNSHLTFVCFDETML